MKNRRAKGFAEDRIKNFWSKVNKTESCWLWTGYKQKNGYGRYGTGGNRSAHRIAYQLVKGPIPAGLHLDHFFCENPSCVNPNHLRPVTSRENTLRGNSISSWHLSKTHCPHGHIYDEENTFRTPTGSRLCRTCRQIRSRKNGGK